MESSKRDVDDVFYLNKRLIKNVVVQQVAKAEAQKLLRAARKEERHLAIFVNGAYNLLAVVVGMMIYRYILVGLGLFGATAPEGGYTTFALWFLLWLVVWDTLSHGIRWWSSP